MEQLHKRFGDEDIKKFMQSYLKREIERKYIQQMLGVGKSRFFKLLSEYKQNPENFSIKYERLAKTRISQELEQNIIKELKDEKKLIDNENIPLKSYNYSYIKDRLKDEYDQEVSLPTIINRAKSNNFYLNKPKRKAHDREVLTNYSGELIQHDSSHHQWSPYAQEKWYLITSLDDYSRFMLHASFVNRETSWNHILAMESIFLKYGLPYSFYVDSHSIFRLVRGRDSSWHDKTVLTDQSNPQWKEVLMDCNVKITYALSPQAKGKIERPYGWLQDRIVRTCARENISDIKQAQYILNREMHRYNYQQRHSTTQEIPYFRFKKALSENKSLFRPFSLKPPLLSSKDIFCLRFQRTTDAYRKVYLNNFELRVNADPHKSVELRISPLNNTLLEVRVWFQNKLIDVQKVKTTDLNLVSTFEA